MVCSFSGEVNESLQHFLVCCYTKDFWAEVKKWFDKGSKHLSDKDIMLGFLRCKDELFVLSYCDNC